MKTVVNKILSPIEKFMHLEASSGIVLVICTLIALILANSPLSEAYEHFIHMDIGFSFGHFSINHSLVHWINDGLMAIFFFVVGMEIKKELFVGTLSNPKQASLALLAALGGMIVPALIYYSFNTSGETVSGWGIPMATDIAFAVGILSLLGKRVPFSLKIFLLALAIVDDLGAVLVIAFFYTENIMASALGGASVAFITIFLFTKAGIKSRIVYILLGITAWFFVLKSGVHATIAGVILGFIMPIRPLVPKNNIEEEAMNLTKKLAEALKKDPKGDKVLANETKHTLRAMNAFSNDSESPVDKSIDTLHPWVGFFIMPVFALANAGVSLQGVNISELLSSNISLGIIFGLVIGKPLGVFVVSFLSVKFGLASLPKGATWSQIIGVGFLAGIGFTMALFISGLAISSAELQVASKIGILCGSVIAGILGVIFLLASTKKNA